MKSRRIFNRVAIIGLGLMGGSLGMAIRRKKLAASVAGYARRARTRRQALAAGAADEVFARPAPAVRNADLVVFCAPVSMIPALARKCAPALSARALLTDVGSSKREIVARMEALTRARPTWLQVGRGVSAEPSAGNRITRLVLRSAAGVRPTLRTMHSSAGVRFVGSHPVAGSERQGLGAASAGLYENATVILTPTPRTDRRALARLKAFWAALGARVAVVSPAAHDRLLARTSHLPHLTAALLASTVGRERPERLARFCGPGFTDATRIAEGSPELWLDIIASNRPAILGELRAYQAGLKRLIKFMERQDFAAVKRFLHQGRNRRRRLVEVPRRAVARDPSGSNSVQKRRWRSRPVCRLPTLAHTQV